MTRKSLILNSPAFATIAAAGILAAAAVGGQLSAQDEPAVKGDRFQVAGEALCGGEAWPNISAACVAWRNGEPQAQPNVRYITVEETDREAGFTELRRVAVPR